MSYALGERFQICKRHQVNKTPTRISKYIFSYEETSFHIKTHDIPIKFIGFLVLVLASARFECLHLHQVYRPRDHCFEHSLVDLVHAVRRKAVNWIEECVVLPEELH